MVKVEFHCRLLAAWLTAVFFWVGSVVAQPVIDSIAQIRRLSPEEAAKNISVLLDAQVVSVGPEGRHFFVFAESAGIYVGRPGDITKQPKVHAGDWIRIDGMTDPGEFAPVIIAHRIEVLRSGPLPVARPYRLDEIHDPASDCDWVSVEGRLTAVSDDTGTHGRVLLTLEMHESIQMGVHLLASEEVWKRLPKLMFSRVRVNALVGTLYNSQRQLTGHVFVINSINDIKLLVEEEASKEPLALPIHSLMRIGADRRQAVRTKGVVTYASPNEIFLRGEGASLRVAVLDGTELQVGQVVEVDGVVWPQPVSPAFRARNVAVLEDPDALPEPGEIILEELTSSDRPEDLLDPRMNYELVRIRAQLVEIGKSFRLSPSDLGDSGQQSLLCRSGSHLFEALLPAGMQAGRQLKSGAFLELTGICNLVQKKNLQWRLYLDRFWIQIRSEGDIVVLQPAPWWTPKRMFWISGTALGLSMLFLIWVVALRKTVDRQTRIIGEKIERESILDERQRIARELHDNLDQGITGAAMQLLGCRKFLETSITKSLEAIRAAMGQSGKATGSLESQLKDQLDAMERDAGRSSGELQSVQAMLAHCGEESRSQILDLRDGLLERMNLPAALRETLAPLADECGAALDVMVAGEPRRLKLVAERNLLLIAKESATNAVRHGAPSHIRVKLCYEDASLSLGIEDDGCGFPLDKLPLAGHFGLLGMRERANKLGAEIRVDSSPGQGTSVKVDLSSIAEWELG
ncbi:sensor histidine kinase [Pontiella sulfatireligans]|nr:sensor histidine kinase [Pontiella sulfatireligans]